MEVRIEKSWKKVLAEEFDKEYFKKLSDFVKEEYRKNKVYPAPKNIFRAFDSCPFDKVKVVILGQDPYHGHGQAMGLSFSVPDGVALPPSLQNIFKEISQNFDLADLAGHGAVTADVKAIRDLSGDLSHWAEQGVLLLNATLTVRAGQAGSHQGQGWEEFTDTAIQALSSGREGLVFMLWGNYAKKKGALIDRKKHLVLESAHPSPFSAHNGFFGNQHFKKANEYLRSKGLGEVWWV